MTGTKINKLKQELEKTEIRHNQLTIECNKCLEQLSKVDKSSDNSTYHLGKLMMLLSERHTFAERWYKLKDELENKPNDR